MRRLALLLTLLALPAVPSIARADDEPPPPLPDPAPAPAPVTTTAPAAAVATTVDAVHLRNGGFYRGRVTEIVPGDHVTVVVEPGGETKRIAWSEVDRVIVASTPVPPAPTPATPVPSTPAAPAPMVGPRARVHVTSPKPVIVYRRAAGSSAFQQVCTSPCDLELPIGDTYRIAGNGLSPKEIHLSAPPNGFVDVVVEPPSTGGMILGGFIAGGGATAGYVGLLMALVGQATVDRSCYSSTCPDDEDGGKSLRNAGLITMLVGAAVTAAGIVIFVNNASTDVSQRASASAPPSAASTASDAFLRRPTWRSVASSAESATGAPAAAFPVLFTHRF